MANKIDQQPQRSQVADEQRESRIDGREIYQQNERVPGGRALARERQAVKHQKQERKRAVRQVGGDPQAVVLRRRKEDQRNRQVEQAQRPPYPGLQIERAERRDRHDAGG